MSVHTVTPEIQAAVVSRMRQRGRRALYFLGSLMKAPGTAFSLVVLVMLLVFSVWPTDWLPHNPEVGTKGARFLPPFFMGGDLTYILGTDRLGRDIFSMLVAGTRYTMLIVVSAAVIGLVLGVTAGLVAGYYRGWVDAVIMRLSDIQLAFPVMVLLIAMTATIGTSILSLILILGVTAWAPYARIVRGAVLTLREREFVEAAVAMGLSDLKIIFRHILPNCLTSVIIFLTFELAGLVLVESALSFLGFGLQPPTPSWGKMVADSRGALYDAWWASALPGVLIVFAVLAFSLLGDELRDRLDPRSFATNFKAKKAKRIPKAQKT